MGKWENLKSLGLQPSQGLFENRALIYSRLYNSKPGLLQSMTTLYNMSQIHWNLMWSHEELITEKMAVFLWKNPSQ